VLFNYQATVTLEVADGNDIIEEIINNGLNLNIILIFQSNPT
jgi:hypothetical protein